MINAILRKVDRKLAQLMLVRERFRFIDIYRAGTVLIPVSAKEKGRMQRRTRGF